MTKKETASTGGSSSCTVPSVERIMNEMSRSFASCKGTNLFQFYNNCSSSRGGGTPCNWTSSISSGLGGIMSLAAPSVPPTPASSASSTGTGSDSSGSSICGDCSSSSWLSSSKPLDFWNTVNILASSSTDATSSTTPSATPTPDGTSISLTSTMNQIFWEHRIVAAVTQRLEDKFTTFMANNSVQMTTTGIFVGAIMGAAVATGVIIGMLITAASATIMVSASTSTTTEDNEEDSSYLSRWIQRLLLLHNNNSTSSNNKRISGGGGEEASPPNSPTIITASKDSADNHESSSSSSTTELFDTTTAPSSGTTTGTKSSSSVIIKANGPLLILQVYPTITTTTTKTTSDNFREQCESCLYNLQTNLVQNQLQWNHIRRLTVYLVKGGEEDSSNNKAVAFRKVLCEFNNKNKNNSSNTNNWNMLISIVYVEKLEQNETALTQIEAMACKDVLLES